MKVSRRREIFTRFGNKIKQATIQHDASCSSGMIYGTYEIGEDSLSAWGTQDCPVWHEKKTRARLFLFVTSHLQQNERSHEKSFHVA